MAEQMAKELTDDTTVIEVKSLIYHREVLQYFSIFRICFCVSTRPWYFRFENRLFKACFHRKQLEKKISLSIFIPNIISFRHSLGMSGEKISM